MIKNAVMKRGPTFGKGVFLYLQLQHPYLFQQICFLPPAPNLVGWLVWQVQTVSFYRSWDTERRTEVSKVPQVSSIARVWVHVSWPTDKCSFNALIVLWGCEYWELLRIEKRTQCGRELSRNIMLLRDGTETSVSYLAWVEHPRWDDKKHLCSPLWVIWAWLLN